MPVDPKLFICGNWKMNGLADALAELAAVGSGLANIESPVDVMICPPATLLAAAADMAASTPLRIGAQDCHHADKGAHTGDICAMMLKDAGAEAVILGHSERRVDHGETDGRVRAKVAAAHRAGLAAIVCVGESEAERAEGRTIEVVTRQLRGTLADVHEGAGTIIAYEPVWAIGTGRTAEVGDIASVHRAIHEDLAGRLPSAVRVIYGGSVTAANALAVMSIPGVDGALVGGASLKAEDFLALIAETRRAITQS